MTAAALSHSGALPWGAPPARGGRHLHAVPSKATQSHTRLRRTGDPVRLTRRGRLAVTLSMLAALAVTPPTVLAMVAPAEAGTEVMVRSGQTLSELAATHLPQARRDLAIVQIQRANELSSNEIQVGQVLQIPSP
ncbi:MAG: LysM peptidoglycan-binding domain-containing protein [Actinobacteria bacterium]|nr:LysM peptidoglycan-binding domain-containing protein [Actinomycetota bacterium]